MDGLERCDETTTLLVHASAVRLGDKGVLLLGRSGSGKSDIALQLIDRGALLIADDQVALTRSGDRLLAAPPSRLAGLIEIRGLGIMRLPYHASMLDLAVRLNGNDLPERLPEPDANQWHGVELPTIDVDPRAPSAAAKIKIALLAERVA